MFSLAGLPKLSYMFVWLQVSVRIFKRNIELGLLISSTADRLRCGPYIPPITTMNSFNKTAL